jgi:hypothetical protein
MKENAEHAKGKRVICRILDAATNTRRPFLKKIRKLKAKNAAANVRKLFFSKGRPTTTRYVSTPKNDRKHISERKKKCRKKK